MRRRYRAYGEPRRIQHAYRIRIPVGALDDRTAPWIGRRSRGIRPGLAALAFLGALAVSAAVLRPWDGLLAPAGAGRTAAPAAAAGAGDAGTGTGSSLGPHGDAVAGVESSDAGVAGARDAWRARSSAPIPAALLTGYIWPTHNARITNTYGLGRPGSFFLDGTKFHDGIDVSSFCGARITAAHDGVVLVASRRNEGYLGWVGDLGPFRERMKQQNYAGQAITVVIDDGNGYRSIYAHLGLTTVDKGDTVRAGDQIGWEGASGNATGCHLHYALFSPLETATLTLDPKIAKKTKLPPAEIARIDPLLVLPPLSDADISWSWGAR